MRANRWSDALCVASSNLNIGNDASVLPPCPLLPVPRPGLDWRALHAYRASDRGGEFYRACLEYGHALLQRGFAARALLFLDRAFGADLRGDEAVLRDHPLPYAAMAWLMANTPADVFLGNPRVHFQHYADRMNAPRREQRRWRAWACWALARAVRPDLPNDPRHRVVEPTWCDIDRALRSSIRRGGSWNRNSPGRTVSGLSRLRRLRPGNFCGSGQCSVIPVTSIGPPVVENRNQWGYSWARARIQAGGADEQNIQPESGVS